VEHQDLAILKGLALTLAGGQVQADRVPVGGHHVMHLHPEGAGRQLDRLAEEPQDRVDAAVVAASTPRPGKCQTISGSNSSRWISMSPLANAS
jgi:hypothetical protein